MVSALCLVPGAAQGQLRSSIASVALVAYAPPGVHWAGTGPKAVEAGASSAGHLDGMTVDREYRIELRAPKERVVLLRRGTPGVVPWDRIRAATGGSESGPVIIDLVVAPTL